MSETVVTIVVCALVAGGVVEVVRRWLAVSWRPSRRVRGAVLLTVSVAVGAVAGVIAGDVLAGLAGGGVGLPAHAALKVALRRWGREAPAPWSLGSMSGGDHGEPSVDEESGDV